LFLKQNIIIKKIQIKNKPYGQQKTRHNITTIKNALKVNLKNKPKEQQKKTKTLRHNKKNNINCVF